MPYLIHTAITKEEREAIFRFRYKVYIEEMMKCHVKADHDNKLLYDEADAYTILYYSCISDNIVATVRSQRGTEGLFIDNEKEYFGIDKFEAYFDYRKIAIVDRLVVDKPYRRGLMAHEMMLKTYVEGLQVGTRLCFITCDDKLLPMYIRYGFRIYTDPAVLSDGEKRHRLLLFLCDKNHLERVRSPFLPHLPEGMDDYGTNASLAIEKLNITLSLAFVE